MSDCDIGMLTTVLIGNSNTFIREGRMVTPRGYANKYSMQDHATHDGEKAGRSLSTGLTGWLENLHADHQAGVSAIELAQRHHLPFDYIQSTLEQGLASSSNDGATEIVMESEA